MTEIIMCVPTRALASVVARGFIPCDEGSLMGLIALNAWFGPRDQLESDDNFRQVIPYVVLRHASRFGVYRRTPKSGERRLRGFLSVGFGGHVRLEDARFEDGGLDLPRTIQLAAQREIQEEVHCQSVDARDTLGFILDDTNEVSRVHLGLIQVWTISKPFIESAESCIAECQMLTAEEVLARGDELESWSRLCASHIAADSAGDVNRMLGKR